MEIPKIDWPNTTNVRALYTPERWRAIPRACRAGREPLKGHSGVFVGREQELQDLQDYFDGTLAARLQPDRRQGRRFVALVTNAPGAGKSTLIEEFRMRQEERGVACVLLGPEMVANEELLLRELVDYVASMPLGRKRQRTDLAVRVGTSSRVAAGVGAIAGALASPVAGVIAGGTLAILQATLKKLHQQWKGTKPTTVKQALQDLSAACEHGFIIFVDECTSWDDPGIDRQALTANLRLFSDLGLGADRNINCGLLLAGLGSAPDVADELRLSRALTIWLGPLSRGEAAQGIGLILAHAQINATRKEHIIGTWAEPLADDFHNWTEHTANAASMALAVAERTELPDDAPPHSVEQERQHLEWVRTLTARAIAALYRSRMLAAGRSAGERTPRRLVALANLTDNSMPMVVVRQLIEYGLKETPGFTADAAGIRAAMREMKEAGFLAPAEYEEDPDDIMEWACIPIPNLRRYITEGAPPASMAAAYELAQRLLSSGEG